MTEAHVSSVGITDCWAAEAESPKLRQGLQLQTVCARPAKGRHNVCQPHGCCHLQVLITRREF